MSREKKFRLNWYQTNDSEAMAAKLEKMAAKGWLLEKVSNFGWTYRRAEPAQVKYTITYFPDASVFDSAPTERQETYADFCQAAGWEFVAAYGPIQFFRSTRPDPIPIETDEGEKLRASHKTMLKTLVLSHVLLLFSFALQLSNQIKNFRYVPFSTVSSNQSLALALLVTGFILYCAAILFDYFIWYHRSKRSVERGGACAKVHTRARLWGGCVLLFFCVLMLAATLSEISSPGMAWVWVYAFSGMALVLVLSQGVMAFLKGRGCSRGTVRGGFVVACVVLAIVYSAGVIPLANWLHGSGLMEGREPAYTYRTEYDRAVDIYQDQLPLTLEDLGFPVTEEDHCSYEAEESRSVLASYATYEQCPYGNGSSLPALQYSVAQIPWRWLRVFCLNSLLEGYWDYQQIDDPRWGAERVYRRNYTSSLDHYLLLYGDRVVSVRASWELTDSQAAQLAARLTN